jgi:hypothetical protein
MAGFVNYFVVDAENLDSVVQTTGMDKTVLMEKLDSAINRACSLVVFTGREGWEPVTVNPNAMGVGHAMRLIEERLRD